MQAAELKGRLDQLGLPRKAAAERLGLSLQGLFGQLNGKRKVSQQTQLLLDYLECEEALKKEPRRALRRRN